MDKTTAIVLGAVVGLSAATAQAADAAPSPAPSAAPASYRDLLAPVDNAGALLRAEDEARAREMATPRIELADAYLQFRFGTPPGYVYGYPYPYGYPPRYYRHHHHHHHHHHHAYYNRHHHHHFRWND